MYFTDNRYYLETLVRYRIYLYALERIYIHSFLKDTKRGVHIYTFVDQPKIQLGAGNVAEFTSLFSLAQTQHLQHFI